MSPQGGLRSYVIFSFCLTYSDKRNRYYVFFYFYSIDRSPFPSKPSGTVSYATHPVVCVSTVTVSDPFLYSYKYDNVAPFYVS